MEIYANNVMMEEEKPSENSKKKASPEVVKISASSKKGFVKNVQHNANKGLLKTLGFGVLGALIYPLVPTVIQAITKWDMSGAKGLITGVGTAATLGLGLGKPEITVGAISAAGTHLLYSKGTRAIENLTNTQIFRMNPDSVVYSQSAV
jgi:hypothetical protein